MTRKSILTKTRIRLTIAYCKFLSMMGIKHTTLNIGNRKFYIRTKDIVSAGIISSKNYEKEIESKINEIVKPGMNVIDIGANMGYFTLILSHLVGSKGKVFAFEPNPTMNEILKKNCEINNLKNVKIFQEALAESKGNLKLFFPGEGYEAWGSFRPPLNKYKTTKEVLVKTTTLDTILEKYGVKKVDFVKMDVEGAEYSIFKGSKKTISSKGKPIIIFECAESNTKLFGHNVLNVLQYLSKFNYEITQISHGNWYAKPSEK